MDNTNKHFSEQWGKRYKDLAWFKDTRFDIQLLSMTHTTIEEWKDKNVLEVGAGSGRYTKGALDLGVKHIVATEYSEGGTNTVKETFKDFPNLIAYQASGTDLSEFKDNAMDIVYSINCIPHIMDYMKAISEMVRICKPGGLICFNVNPKRPETIIKVDGTIREATTQFCPDCLEKFSKAMVKLSKIPEFVNAVKGVMEISGDELSAYDHLGLPFVWEIEQQEFINQVSTLPVVIEKIDNRICVKLRKK